MVLRAAGTSIWLVQILFRIPDLREAVEQKVACGLRLQRAHTG